MKKRIRSIIVVGGLIVALNFGCQNLTIQIPGIGNSGSSAPSACPTGSMTCVTLNWTPSSTAGVSYHVWQGASSGAYTVMYDAGPNTSYQVSGLVTGTYFFAVTAYNSNGDSIYSNEVSPVIPLMLAREIEEKGEVFIEERAFHLMPEAKILVTPERSR